MISFLTCVLGQNMSVLGSQLEIDMDPEGEAAIVPRHQVGEYFNFEILLFISFWCTVKMQNFLSFVKAFV